VISLDNDLIDFLTDIDHVANEEDIFPIFLDAVKSLGAETACYTYAQKNEDGTTTASFQTNYPKDWVDYYTERNFQNNDYLIKHLLENTTLPITHDLDTLGDGELSSEDGKEMWHTVADLGMRRGLAIPFFGLSADGYGGMLIGSNLVNTDEFQKILTEKGAVLYSMAQVTHQLLKHKYMNTGALGAIILSPRQKEIVKFISQGISNKEISYRLNISMPTISFHLKAVAQKLDVRTNREILPKAIALGLVNF